MNSSTGEVCIPNISVKERRKRLASAVVMEIFCLAVLTVLLATDASPWWRLLMFPLFAAAASGYFQWRDKTWVGLSARGSRQLGETVEKIEDPDELLLVRFQARKVQLKAVITGLLMTLFVMFIP